MRFNYIISILSLVAISILFVSCSSGLPDEGKVVFTQLPAKVSGDIGDYRYATSMEVVLAEMTNSLEKIEVLTSDFHSARSPEVSYDGTQLVFSAQKNDGDVWQIWILSLESRDAVQVTGSPTNCTDPTWLPDDRIAFSKQVSDEKGISHHALFTIGLDGCCEHRITFQPHEDLHASVLNDGRILVASQQIYPETANIKYLAMRPDGTKAELFYSPEEAATVTKALENDHGKILFAESGNLSSVDFSRPLHSRSVISQGAAAVVRSAFPMTNDQVLVSVKKNGERSFGLAVMDLNDPGKEDFYYNDSEYHALEPVIVKPRPVAKKLPTRVNLELESGYFVCMNSDQSIIDVEAGKTAKVQVLGIDKLMGEAEVAEDGSFYLEMKADEPVRFQTLSATGEILRGPSSWMWVRPNERRGCVGCHENQEIAPENVVPKAMEKDPVAMLN
jgi:hypothetical protein